MAILVTGAAGYIGSHTCVELLTAGFDVVGIDNFDNSSPVVIERVQRLSGSPMEFYELDLLNDAALRGVFARHPDIDAVVHFGGLKAVGESVDFPLRYYRTNVSGSIGLLQVMEDFDARRIVFSSSCTVYGDPAPEAVPLTEDSPLRAVNPYGRTKVLVEQVLEDLSASDPRWASVALRYFNPIGAHASGEIGEDPIGVPNNLLPYVTQVAVGRRDQVRVFGGDYPTVDGTCVRDYIHVVDLALGHLAAIRLLLDGADGFEAINLGTGHGSTVLEVIAATETAVGQTIPYEIVERRAGDAVAVFADPSFARTRLGWNASRDLHEMCADHWNWQRRNPKGFQ